MAVWVRGKSSLSEIIESAHKKQEFALIPTKVLLAEDAKERGVASGIQ